MTIGANLLVVADDEAAVDQLQQQLMMMTAESSGVGVRFFTLAKTIEVIHKASPSQKIFIICRTPSAVRTLIEGGVPIQEVNVGNMHYTVGKRSISKKVYVDDNDLAHLHWIKSRVAKLYIQDVPGDLKEDVK